MANKLNRRQSDFVEEYLIDLNATQAAIRAGYSKKTAHVIGHQNLRKPKILERIQARREELRKSLEITPERVLREEARLAFVDVGDLFDDQGRLLDVSEVPEDARRAIAGIEITERMIPMGKDIEPEKEIKYKYKMADKGRALERVSKHLGLYIEKKEISGPGGGPIETKITDFPTEPMTVAEWETLREEAEARRNGLIPDPDPDTTNAAEKTP